MTTEKRIRRKYSEELQRGSGAHITELDYKMSKAARRVNINANLLSKWRDRLAKESAEKRLTVNEPSELKELH